MNEISEVVLLDAEEPELDPRFEGIADEPEPDTPEGDAGAAAVEGLTSEFPEATAEGITAVPSRPSGLLGHDIVVARDMAMQAAWLGVNHERQIHYTQQLGPRWEGINRKLKAWRGQFPSYADCSSFVTWCLWNGLDHFHRPDVVNGLAWRAGYTGTMLRHGWQLPSGASLQRGDAVIYGNAWPGEHTAIFIGGGKTVSHGSEQGPHVVPVHQGMNVLSIRRYI